MGKYKNTTKGSASTQRGSSHIPSSCDGEGGDTAQDLMEEVASLEEVLSQMGAPSKMPFRFGRTSRPPSE